jgi:hypothetical protein
VPDEATSFTPETIRPLPKAGPRQQKKNNRRKRHCEILTDTPVKNVLETEALERATKRSKSTAKRPKLDMAASASKRDKCQTEKSKTKAKRQKKTNLMTAAAATRDDEPLEKHRSSATRTTRRPKPASKRLPLPRKPVWLDKVTEPGWFN